MKQRLQSLRTCTWWQLLLAAIASGVISGLVVAILGVFGSQAIATYLSHGKQTELGDAVLAIYTFLALGATGFIAAFSGTYGIARRKGYVPVTITCATLSINVLGLFVPTGGNALLPFYASVVTGVVLTVIFLMPRHDAIQ